jgi:hypothetical protein
MEKAVEEKKTEARKDIDRSEQREKAKKAPLLTSTRKVFEKGREKLELINVLMTGRPKIRPFRTAFRRRVDEFVDQGKLRKGLNGARARMCVPKLAKKGFDSVS